MISTLKTIHETAASAQTAIFDSTSSLANSKTKCSFTLKLDHDNLAGMVFIFIRVPHTGNNNYCL